MHTLPPVALEWALEWVSGLPAHGSPGEYLCKQANGRNILLWWDRHSFVGVARDWRNYPEAVTTVGVSSVDIVAHARLPEN